MGTGGFTSKLTHLAVGRKLQDLTHHEGLLKIWQLASPIGNDRAGGRIEREGDRERESAPEIKVMVISFNLFSEVICIITPSIFKLL